LAREIATATSSLKFEFHRCCLAMPERGASRSPRGGRGEEEEEPQDPEMPEWNGNGVSPVERSFMGQLSHQRAYLEQVFKPEPPPPADGQPPPKKLAAGMPLDAARALVMLGPEPNGVPCWQGMPAEAACLAAALRLFGRLLPGKLDEEACGRFVMAERFAADKRPQRDAVSAIEEGAALWGLTAQRVPTAEESLKAMVRNRAAACCIFLESYVGVLEDPQTGEELEEEVGNHCLLVVGGDLLGPNFVTFDPYGLSGGEVSFWSAHNVKNAAPVAYVELCPRLE